MKSKKDRLKEQSLKQLEKKKQLEQEEKELQINAIIDDKLSLSSIKLVTKEPLACRILKFIMLVPILYSAFFYGGITVVAILKNYIDDVPNSNAYFMLGGIALLLAGVFIAFMKKYVLSFAAVVAGTLLYLKPARYIIAQAKYRLENNYVTDEEISKLDKTYMIRYYPILLLTAISLALLVIFIIRKYLKLKRVKSDRDNAPVKSIVED